MVLHDVGQVPRPLDVVFELVSVDEDQRAYHRDEYDRAEIDEAIKGLREAKDQLQCVEEGGQTRKDVGGATGVASQALPEHRKEPKET